MPKKKLPDPIGSRPAEAESLKSAHGRPNILAIAPRNYRILDDPPDLFQRPSASPFFGVERGT